MDIQPIRTESDCKAALRQISTLMESDPEPGTPDGDRLDILATLVQAYEAKHVPILAPDPVEAIKFRMEQSGLSVKDLEPMIGKSNRVYEVLSRKRPLTLAMIDGFLTLVGSVHYVLPLSVVSLLIRPTACVLPT
jgi:HTH-type transcriptional regulator/antitoxin HigA